MFNISAYADEIIVVTSAVVGVFAVWKLVWPFLKFLHDWFSETKQHMALMRVIAQEFRPNGGSSMKDSLNRLEKSQGEIKTEILDIKIEAQKMGAKQWALVATQKDPVFETNDKGECTRVNIMYSNLAERTFDDLRGYGWENFMHDADRDEVVSTWTDCVAKRKSYEGCFRVVGAVSRKVYHVCCVANPFFDTEGSVLGYIGRYIKVDELKS